MLCLGYPHIFFLTLHRRPPSKPTVQTKPIVPSVLIYYTSFYICTSAFLFIYCPDQHFPPATSPLRYSFCLLLILDKYGYRRGITPPHRVKSISMATFTPEEIDFVKARGNDVSDYLSCYFFLEDESNFSLVKHVKYLLLIWYLPVMTHTQMKRCEFIILIKKKTMVSAPFSTPIFRQTFEIQQIVNFKFTVMFLLIVN